jgi:hypothetical protein
MLRGVVTWGTTSVCAVLAWLSIGVYPYNLILAFIAATTVYSLADMIIERLRTARWRSRGKTTTLDVDDLPVRETNFPMLNIASAVIAFISAYILVQGYLDSQLMMYTYVGVYAFIFAFFVVFAALYAFNKFCLWLIAQSSETVFTAAEALRRRKFKETIYAESDGDPLNVSDLRGDVSVGDDGELLDKPKHEADNR